MTTLCDTVSTMAEQAKTLHLELPAMLTLLGGEITVTHSYYRLARYSDKSVLAWTRYDGYFTWPFVPLCAWTTAEHAVRCMGLFTAAERANLLQHADKWVDGVHWGADGSFIEF